MVRATIRCPGCKASVSNREGDRPPSFPFCSKRCRLVDFGKWLDGSYSVPAALGPEDEEALLAELEAGEPVPWVAGSGVGEA